MLIVGHDRGKLAKAARADRAEKLSCESLAAPDFKRMFKRMGDDFDAVYSHTGHVLSLEPYEADIRGNLRDCYRRVTDRFKTNIRVSLDPELNARYHAPAVNKAVNNRLVKYMDDRAPRQARHILKTTRERMGNALASAHVEAAQAGVPGDQHFIGGEMRKWFHASAAGRAATIATVEVNCSAEFTKHVEAVVIKYFAPKNATLVLLEKSASGMKSIILPVSGLDFEKTWVADLDEKTRSWHAAMDYTSVGLDEFFVVNGENMFYPGDDEHGASLENLINCRCAAAYNIPTASALLAVGVGLAVSKPDESDEAE